LKRKKNAIHRHALLAAMTLGLAATIASSVIHHEIAKKMGDFTVEASVEIFVARLIGKSEE
jgi:hypothetical protein